MTVSNTTVKQIYNGNGATTTFAIPFSFILSSEVKVYLIDNGTPTAPTLELQTVVTHYNLAGSNVEFVAAPTSNYKVLILRENALTQDRVYAIGDGFPPVEHEKVLDKIVKMVQENAEKLARSILAQHMNTASLTLPMPVAGKAIAWNGTATGLVNVSIEGPTGPMGPAGGGLAPQAVQNITAAGQVTLSADMQQLLRVQGSGAARTTANAPFSSTPANGTILVLVGRDATNTVTVPFADVAGGCLLNGNCVLGLNETLTLGYDSTANRYFELCRSV